MVDFICMDLLEVGEKRELQNEKFLSTVGFEPGTFHLRSKRANQCATIYGIYRAL